MDGVGILLDLPEHASRPLIALPGPGGTGTCPTTSSRIATRSSVGSLAGFDSLKDDLRAALAVPGIAAHALDSRAGPLEQPASAPIVGGVVVEPDDRAF